MEELCDPASAEPWEGMLVSVDNLTVTDVAVFGGSPSVVAKVAARFLSVQPLPPLILVGFSWVSLFREYGSSAYAFDAFQILPRNDDVFVG